MANFNQKLTQNWHNSPKMINFCLFDWFSTFKNNFKNILNGTSRVFKGWLTLDTLTQKSLKNKRNKTTVNFLSILSVCRVKNDRLLSALSERVGHLNGASLAARVPLTIIAIYLLLNSIIHSLLVLYFTTFPKGFNLAENFPELWQNFIEICKFLENDE